MAGFTVNAGASALSRRSDLQQPPVRERFWLLERRPDLNDDIGVRREWDLRRVTVVDRAVHPDASRFTFLRLRRRDLRARDRLPPHREEITERERAVHRRFDVNDSVRRMRVQPINATRADRNPDVLRDELLDAVVVNREMLVDVNALALLRVARDAIDGLSHRLAERS